MVKGSTSGVSTDANGNFSIQAAPGSRIVISAAEYVAQEFVVGRGNVINASLVRQDIALTEVVVVGYGTQRKRDVTGAISKVNSETLLQTASHNVLDQLKGHAAGVNITSTSAVPGGGSQIRIRGNRTMLANTAPANVTGSTFSSEAAGADRGRCSLSGGRWDTLFGQP